MTASCKLWTALVVFRFIWCLWPQQGYVDPAEFFEGTSTLASHILGLDNLTAPGYNTPNPQMTIFFPYITAGVGFHLLKRCNDLGIVQVSAHTLLVASRLMMTFVSLIGDACIYKICTILGLNAAAGLVIFSSSFVTLVFLTRNMTHAINASTFALMLLLVIDSRKSQFVRHLSTKNSKDVKDGTKRSIKRSPNHGFWLGVFVLEGTFNHPSFFIYSLIPMVFWLTGSATNFGVGAVKIILTNIASLLPGIISMGTCLLILDSVFYGTLNAHVLLKPQLLVENLNIKLVNNLTVAPINFLHYNFQNEHVEIKPKLTHFLVNLPLLFFPLIVSFVSELYTVYSGKSSEDNTTITSSTIRAFLALSFTTPLLVFSLLPTQDPKLLLPLIIPLVLLYADTVILPATRMPNAPWVVWNTIFGLIFGLFLEGGVVPSLGEMQSMVSKPVMDRPIMYHYVFYRTPTPPQYLLVMPPVVDAKTSGNQTNMFKLHDLGDVDRIKLHQTINMLLRDWKMPDQDNFKTEIYVFAPASVDVLFCRINVKFTYKFIKGFTPHLSLNVLPDLFPDYTCSAEKYRSYKDMGLTKRIPRLFSLNMYKVEVVRHTVSLEGMVHPNKFEKPLSFNQ